MHFHKALFPIFLLLFAFVPVTTATAQEKAERTEASSSQEKATQKGAERGQFVDEDGDGINDNAQSAKQQDPREQRQQMRERRRDHFIDADGDGINDERCSGMGVSGGERRGQQRGGGGR
jgi:hypothetical protein